MVWWRGVILEGYTIAKPYRGVSSLWAGSKKKRDDGYTCSGFPYSSSSFVTAVEWGRTTPDPASFVITTTTGKGIEDGRRRIKKRKKEKSRTKSLGQTCQTTQEPTSSPIMALLKLFLFFLFSFWRKLRRAWPHWDGTARRTYESLTRSLHTPELAGRGNVFPLCSSLCR